MNSVNSSLYIKECTQYVVYSLVYTVHCILWTVYSIQYALQYTLTALHTYFLCGRYTQYDTLYNVDCGLFTVNGVQYSLDRIMYVLCTVYCLHQKPLNSPRYYSDVRIFGKLRQMAKNAIMTYFLNYLYMNYSNLQPILSTLVFA